MLVGFPERWRPERRGAASPTARRSSTGGRIAHVARKSLLPTYDVFDEWRYFEPATDVAPVAFRGRRLGISICEDIWNDADFWPRRLYRADPIETLVAPAPRSSSTSRRRPYTMEKRHLRPRMLAATARRWRRPLVFVNQVGGQDDLVFDGASLVSRRGRRGRRARAPSTRPTWSSSSSTGGRGRVASCERSRRSDERSALGALALGTRDYARRCGFSARAARPLGRHRLGARRLHRRARARPATTCSAWRCRRASRRRARSPTPRALAREPRHRLHGRSRSSRCSRPTSRRSRPRSTPSRPPARPRPPRPPPI